MYQIIINETDLQDKEGFESFLNKNLHSGKQVFHVGKFFSIFKSSDTTNGCYALSYKDSTTHGIRCFAPDVSINLLPSGQPSIKRDNMWEINTMSHYNNFSIFDIKRSASLMILIFFAVILCFVFFNLIKFIFLIYLPIVFISTLSAVINFSFPSESMNLTLVLV